MARTGRRDPHPPAPLSVPERGIGARIGSILLLLLAGCGGEKTKAPEATAAAAEPAKAEKQLFRDATEESGLVFHHYAALSGRHLIAENMGSGVALFDADGDGDLDVFFVQGGPLRPGAAADPAFPLRHPEPSDRLYRNELAGGRLRFADVTATSGLAGGEPGVGVATGDIDNDGDVDLYVTQIGPDRLWRNRGDGTFEDVTKKSGADDPRFSVPATFFDYDRDGDLDLFVGNYLDEDFESPKVCRSASGAVDICGPSSYPPQPDSLFRNRGDGTFENVTTRAGLPGRYGPALGVVAADLDLDGWLDLYVANDQTSNQMWMNRGDGTFEDRALLGGTAVNAEGLAQASMGILASDFDGDGDDELFMTHLTGETNTFYRNDGHGLFTDTTAMTGLAPLSRFFTGFGVVPVDAENDGDLDLFIVNGAVRAIEELEKKGDPYPYHQRKVLFLNNGASVFTEVTPEKLPLLALTEVGRGLALGDLDNDGDQDLAVANNNGPGRIYLNETGQDRNWIGFRLTDPAGRVDQLGARASLERPGKPALSRRVAADGSYASANDPRLLFGLGDDPAVGDLTVWWPDGKRERFAAAGLKAGQYQTLRRGSGAPVP
jgi:hypothetical protein